MRQSDAQAIKKPIASKMMREASGITTLTEEGEECEMKSFPNVHNKAEADTLTDDEGIPSNYTLPGVVVAYDC